MLQLVVIAASGFVLAMMYSKVWIPFARPPEGVQVHSTTLGVMQKVMVHRWQILIVLGLANIGSLPGLESLRMSAGAVLLIDVLVVVAIFMPTRYRYTAEGFALGRGKIIPWNSFKRYRMGAGRIQFETKGEKPRRVNLFLNNVQQQALRPVIKRYFKSPPSESTSS